jgi:hypothetical protein
VSATSTAGARYLWRRRAIARGDCRVVYNEHP